MRKRHELKKCKATQINEDLTDIIKLQLALFSDTLLSCFKNNCTLLLLQLDADIYVNKS